MLQCGRDAFIIIIFLTRFSKTPLWSVTMQLPIFFQKLHSVCDVLLRQQQIFSISSSSSSNAFA